MTIKNLKENLLRIGFTDQDLKDKNKKELQDIYDRAVTVDSTLNDASVIQTDDALEFNPLDSDPPLLENQHQYKPTDPEWTDWVMGQFTDREKDQEGNPKVDGLRRIAEKLLGTFNIITKEVHPPGLDRGATVVVRIEFVNKYGDIFRAIEGSADVSTHNTQREFAIHAVATAETRAEGRALRKALRLTKVLIAEEMQNADPNERNDSDNQIPSSMVASLKMMADKVKVDLDAIAKRDFGVESSSDLSKIQGKKIANLLYEYNSGTREIEDEIKTF